MGYQYIFISSDKLSFISQSSQTSFYIQIVSKNYLGLVATRPVFRVSEKARLNPVSSATETSYEIENSPVAS